MFALTHPSTWTITEWAIAIVIMAAIAALVIIALRAFQITPPPWLIQVLWVVVACIVIVAAIKFVASL